MLPNLVIIGAQKSASSLIHKCLREHPEVFMPGDEVDFFENPTYSSEKIFELEKLLTSAKDEKIIGIKRADYLARPECPAHLAKHIPKAKLIAILREPIARLVSAYYWYMKLNYLPLAPLNEGVSNIMAGKYTSNYPKSQDLLNYGLYYQHLTRYQDYFDPKQLFIFQHDEIKNNVKNVLTRLFTNLKIDPCFTPKSIHSTPKKSVYNLQRLKFLTHPLTHAYALGFYEPDKHIWRRTAWKNNIDYFRKALIVGTDQLILAKTFPNEKPHLSDELSARLTDFYLEDQQQLATLLASHHRTDSERPS